MPNTYKKITSVTVGSGGAASIDFTNIPQTYTDLKIVLSGRSTQGNVYGGGALQFNSDTGGNYRWRRLRGDAGTGAAASDNSTSATAITNWDMAGANATASIFGNIEIYIPNYTSANAKSVSVDYVGENNAAESHMGIVAGIWTGTASITSIKLYSAGGNLTQHTTATLYGIGDVTASKFAKATGGVITYDANYVYHTYPYSGTFTPNTALTVDYLVVAGGGGGGGGDLGAGGGAGGYRTTSGTSGGNSSAEVPLSLSSGSAYTVTVGAGGGGSSLSANKGTNGNNSVFATITSTGGGGGSSNANNIGATGGSGGGGGTVNPPNADRRGLGTANQGFDGGYGTQYSGQYAAGGGGGAGAVGGNGNSTVGGAGGNGLASSINGISVTRAGGGAGSGDNSALANGGSGGGGNNQAGSSANGTINTGSGGGGTETTGGTGGSGIVIIRYPR